MEALVTAVRAALVVGGAVPDLHLADGLGAAEIDLPPGVVLLACVRQRAVVPHAVGVAVHGTGRLAAPPRGALGGGLVEGEVVGARRHGQHGLVRGSRSGRVRRHGVVGGAVVVHRGGEGVDGPRGPVDRARLGGARRAAVPLVGGCGARGRDRRQGDALAVARFHRLRVLREDRRRSLQGLLRGGERHGQRAPQGHRVPVVRGAGERQPHGHDRARGQFPPLPDGSCEQLRTGRLDGLVPVGDFVGRLRVELALEGEGDLLVGFALLLADVGVHCRGAPLGAAAQVEAGLVQCGLTAGRGQGVFGRVLGRAGEGDLDDGLDLVGTGATERHLHGGALLGVGQPGAGAVDAHRGDRRADARQRQGLAVLPRRGEHEQVVALRRGAPPVRGGEPRGARPGDRVGVAAHPLADAVEDLLVEGVEGAVALGADVEVELAVGGHGVHEVVHRPVDEDRQVLLGAVRAERGRAVAPALREDRQDRLPRLHLEGRAHLVVAADLEIAGVVPHAGVHHRGGLQLVDPGRHLLGLLGGGVAHVEPELGDGAVVGEELGELGLDDAGHHEVVDLVAVRVGLGLLVRPVDDRVVEGQFDADLPALLGQLLHRVASEGRRLDDVVVRGLRVPHGEAVVVLRRDHHVLHARVLGGLAHVGGVPLVGRHRRGLRLVVAVGDLLPGFDLLGVAHALGPALVHALVGGVDAPVHEQAELEALPVGDLLGRAERHGEGDPGRRPGRGGGGLRTGIGGGWGVCESSVPEACQRQGGGHRRPHKGAREFHVVPFIM